MSRRARVAVGLLLSPTLRSREKPCHGTGFRYGSRPTALYVNRAFDCNANDVAHTATFPPAATRHGGRHHIHPRRFRRFVPTVLSVYESSTMDVFVVGDPGYDDPEPLYVTGRSVVVVNTLAGCDFRRGCDPMPLYVRGQLDMNAKEDVIDGTFNSSRHLGWLESEGVMYPRQTTNTSARDEDSTPAVRRTDGI